MKDRLKNIIKKILTLPKKVFIFIESIPTFVKFILLLIFTFIKFVLKIFESRKNQKSVNKFENLHKFSLLKLYNRFYIKVLKAFDTKGEKQVKNSDLIMLALRNLSTKKSRTYVTIGGMAVGFGAVILLLSFGYGFERLVINKVASLTQMKQIDVTTSQTSPIKFSNSAVENISKIKGVDAVIPIVTSVSKVTYNNAVSDVIVYAVPTRYIEESEFSVIKGNVYKENLIYGFRPTIDEGGVVAGATTEVISKDAYNKEIKKINYAINPLVWKAVYINPSTKSQIIGYTKREAGKKDAIEVWGKKYTLKDAQNISLDSNGVEYSRWISDTFTLWKKQPCDYKTLGCVDNSYVPIKNELTQKISSGYITEEKLAIERFEISKNENQNSILNSKIKDVSFKMGSEKEVDIFFNQEENTAHSKLIVGTDEILSGELILGKSYSSDSKLFFKASDGRKYGYWIKSNSKLWEKEDCKGICQTYHQTKEGSYTKEIAILVYIKLSDVEIIDNAEKGEVLGEQDVEGTSMIDISKVMEQDKSIDWAAISSDLGKSEAIKKDILKFPDSAQKVALVNTAMLTMLGIDANSAMDKEFSANLIFDSKLFDKTNYLVESENAKFKITGIINDSSAPTFYIPLQDIQVEGIKNVSKVKVVVKNKEDVAGVRDVIESSGFQTNSVIDTVDKIGSLFSSLRIALFALGLIALGVASLGMFNTLTVSLMEKTREVGLMKTMGMKSEEVKTLFLAESVIMSVFGGISGLFLGFAIGKLLSLSISFLAISQGQGMLDVTYIPFLLGASTVFLSLIVGIITGWYPAKRATAVSALNALRYE